jgi:starch synthase
VPLSAFLMPPVSSSTPRRSVLLVGSEAQPFAKTGGLADVLGALPSALQRLGWDATVAIPRYRGVSAGTLIDRFPVTVGGYTRDAGFYQAPLADGATALLVDCPDLYDRPGIYGADTTDYPDSPRRFAFLARAALEHAGRGRTRPAIVHAHDWQAGLVPVYLTSLYASHPVLAGTPSVFTIHNLAYQGAYESDWLPRLDLGWDQFTVDRLEFYGRISLLKGGINAAAVITTVSPRYAQEIQTPAFGFGFDGILRARAADLAGILNGIDATAWDPARDPFLPTPFHAADLSGKRDAKIAVLQRYSLPTAAAALKRPLIGMVSRMVDQKGFDLIAAAMDDLMGLDVAFVVLGTGEPRYQDLWRATAARYPDRVGARIGFDESLAHLIEGGADIFLMPSRFEPCGLNQMYSMRYGTVPIVNGVGGLADTVIDYVPATPQRGQNGRVAPKPGEGALAGPSRGEDGTGFVLASYTPAALLDALRRAIAAFGDAGEWKAIQLAGMRQDFSWDRSAREYVKIYERALAGG